MENKEEDYEKEYEESIVADACSGISFSFRMWR